MYFFGIKIDKFYFYLIFSNITINIIKNVIFLLIKKNLCKKISKLKKLFKE